MSDVSTSAFKPEELEEFSSIKTKLSNKSKRRNRDDVDSTIATAEDLNRWDTILDDWEKLFVPCRPNVLVKQNVDRMNRAAEAAELVGGIPELAQDYAVGNTLTLFYKAIQNNSYKSDTQSIFQEMGAASREKMPEKDQHAFDTEKLMSSWRFDKRPSPGPSMNPLDYLISTIWNITFQQYMVPEIPPIVQLLLNQVDSVDSLKQTLDALAQDPYFYNELSDLNQAFRGIRFHDWYHAFEDFLRKLGSRLSILLVEHSDVVEQEHDMFDALDKLHERIMQMKNQEEPPMEDLSVVAVAVETVGSTRERTESMKEMPPTKRQRRVKSKPQKRPANTLKKHQISQIGQYMSALNELMATESLVNKLLALTQRLIAAWQGAFENEDMDPYLGPTLVRNMQIRNLFAPAQLLEMIKTKALPSGKWRGLCTWAYDHFELMRLRNTSSIVTDPYTNAMFGLTFGELEKLACGGGEVTLHFTLNGNFGPDWRDNLHSHHFIYDGVDRKDSSLIRLCTGSRYRCSLVNGLELAAFLHNPLAHPNPLGSLICARVDTIGNYRTVMDLTKVQSEFNKQAKHCRKITTAEMWRCLDKASAMMNSLQKIEALRPWIWYLIPYDIRVHPLRCDRMVRIDWKCHTGSVAAVIRNAMLARTGHMSIESKVCYSKSEIVDGMLPMNVGLCDDVEKARIAIGAHVEDLIADAMVFARASNDEQNQQDVEMVRLWMGIMLNSGYHRLPVENELPFHQCDSPNRVRAEKQTYREHSFFSFMLKQVENALVLGPVYQNSPSVFCYSIPYIPRDDPRMKLVREESPAIHNFEIRRLLCYGSQPVPYPRPTAGTIWLWEAHKMSELQELEGARHLLAYLYPNHKLLVGVQEKHGYLHPDQVYNLKKNALFPADNVMRENNSENIVRMYVNSYNDWKLVQLQKNYVRNTKENLVHRLDQCYGCPSRWIRRTMFITPSTKCVNEAPSVAAQRFTRTYTCYVVPCTRMDPDDELQARLQHREVREIEETPGLYHTYWYTTVSICKRSVKSPKKMPTAVACQPARWEQIRDFAERLARVNPLRLIEVPLDMMQGSETIESKDGNILIRTHSLRVGVRSEWAIFNGKSAPSSYSTPKKSKNPTKTGWFESLFQAQPPLMIYEQVRLLQILEFLCDVEAAGLLKELPVDFLSFLAPNHVYAVDPKTGKRGQEVLGLRMLPFIYPRRDSSGFVPWCNAYADDAADETDADARDAKPLTRFVTIGEAMESSRERNPEQAEYTVQQFILDLITHQLGVLDYFIEDLSGCAKFYDITRQKRPSLIDELVSDTINHEVSIIRELHLRTILESKQIATLAVPDAEFRRYFWQARDMPLFRSLTFAGLLKTGSLLCIRYPSLPTTTLRLEWIKAAHNATEHLLMQLIATEVDQFDSHFLELPPRLMMLLGTMGEDCARSWNQSVTFTDDIYDDGDDNYDADEDDDLTLDLAEEEMREALGIQEDSESELDMEPSEEMRHLLEVQENVHIMIDAEESIRRSIELRVRLGNVSEESVIATAPAPAAPAAPASRPSRKRQAEGWGELRKRIAWAYEGHYLFPPSITQRAGTSTGISTATIDCLETYIREQEKRYQAVTSAHETDRQILTTIAGPGRPLKRYKPGETGRMLDVLRLATSIDVHLFNDDRQFFERCMTKPGHDSDGHQLDSWLTHCPELAEMRIAKGIGLAKSLWNCMRNWLSPLHCPASLMRSTGSRYMIFRADDDPEFMVQYIQWAMGRTLVGGNTTNALLPIHPAYLLAFVRARAAITISTRLAADQHLPLPGEYWLAMQVSQMNDLDDSGFCRSTGPEYAVKELIFPGHKEDNWDMSEFVYGDAADAFAREMYIVNRGALALERYLLSHKEDIIIDNHNNLKSTRNSLPLQWVLQTTLPLLDPLILGQMLFAEPVQAFKPRLETMLEFYERVKHNNPHEAVVMPHWGLHFGQYFEMLMEVIRTNKDVARTNDVISDSWLYVVARDREGKLTKVTSQLLLYAWLDKTPEGRATVPLLAEFAGMHSDNEKKHITFSELRNAWKMVVKSVQDEHGLHSHHEWELESNTKNAWEHAKREVQRLPGAHTCTNELEMRDYMTGFLPVNEADMNILGFRASTSLSSDIETVTLADLCFCGSILPHEPESSRSLCACLSQAQAGIHPIIDTILTEPRGLNVYNFEEICDAVFPQIARKMETLFKYDSMGIL